MKLECVNGCDMRLFVCDMKVVVNEDGSFTETHLRHFRMHLDDLVDYVICAECGDTPAITN